MRFTVSLAVACLVSGRASSLTQAARTNAEREIDAVRSSAAPADRRTAPVAEEATP